MSLKCLKLIPLATNYLKSNKAVVQRLNLHPNLLNQVSIRFSSSNNDITKENASPTVLNLYYGILTPQIKAVKIFSMSSSFIGIAAQPVFYQQIATTGKIGLIVAAYSFIGFFTLVTPLLLHLITKKYVTHLDYKPETDTYVAKTVNFFCMTKEIEFKPEQVVVPDVPGMFTTLIADGKAIFLDPRLFQNPSHYARLMGYDKPMDFKLYENQEGGKQS